MANIEYLLTNYSNNMLHRINEGQFEGSGAKSLIKTSLMKEVQPLSRSGYKGFLAIQFFINKKKLSLNIEILV